MYLFWVNVMRNERITHRPYKPKSTKEGTSISDTFWRLLQEEETSAYIEKRYDTKDRSIIVHQEILTQLRSLLAGEDNWVAIMATTVCSLHHGFSHFDWTGFYCVHTEELLTIGPYQGGHGCLRIPFSKGVCGAAARTRETQWVRDVHTRKDHIACSSTTQSEVVVPICTKKGELIAVLDVDSDTLDAFSQEDVLFLEEVAQEIAKRYEMCQS